MALQSRSPSSPTTWSWRSRGGRRRRGRRRPGAGPGGRRPLGRRLGPGAVGGPDGRRRRPGRAAGELTGLMVREVGKPVTEAAGEAARGVGILRYYAQQALDPDGETYPGPARGPAAARRRPAGWPADHPLELPGGHPLWKAAPALAFGNAVLLKPSPTPPRSPCAWPSCWPRPCPTPAPGPARRGRDRPGHAGGGGLRLVHRLGGRGPPGRGGRHRARPAQPGRDGRPQRLHRARRRRPGAGGGGGGRGGHGLRRPEVHRHQPGHRGRRPRPVHRGPGRGRPGPGRRRPRRQGHGRGAGHHRAGPRQGGGGGPGGRGRRRAAAHRRPAGDGPAGSWPRPWSTAWPGRPAGPGGGVRPDRRAPARGRRGRGVRVANGVRYGLVASVFTGDLDRALRPGRPARHRPDPGQRPHLGGRLPGPVRGREGLQLRPPRAGQGGPGALHLDPDHHRPPPPG
jgi:hypothetical protein